MCMCWCSCCWLELDHCRRSSSSSAAETHKTDRYYKLDVLLYCIFRFNGLSLSLSQLFLTEDWTHCGWKTAGLTPTVIPMVYLDPQLCWEPLC